MANQHGLDSAAEVLKQLIGLSTGIIAATFALLIAFKVTHAHQNWAIASAVAGGLCILGALLFLTDVAANSLGTTDHSTHFRLWLFVITWALFLLCAITSGVYALEIAGVL